MTKPKEPSKATLKAWKRAIHYYMTSMDNYDIHENAARIIQRHVDREVRKAVKRQAKVVRCAEYLAEASEEYLSRIPDASLDDRLRMELKERICINQLIAAVKAMKEGKK